jgi:hypothetical protein
VTNFIPFFFKKPNREKVCEIEEIQDLGADRAPCPKKEEAPI